MSAADYACEVFIARRHIDDSAPVQKGTACSAQFAPVFSITARASAAPRVSFRWPSFLGLGEA